MASNSTCIVPRVRQKWLLAALVHASPTGKSGLGRTAVRLPKTVKAIVLIPDHCSPEAYERQPYPVLVNQLAAMLLERHGPQVCQMDIVHDDDCPLTVNDGLCRCNPWLEARVDGHLVGTYRDGVFKVRS